MRALIVFFLLFGSAVQAQPDLTPADLHAVVRTGNAALLTRLLDGGLSPDAETDDIGQTNPLLNAAAGANQVELVRLLLSRGASVDARGAYGATPLHAAASADTAVVRRLLDAGADPNARTGEGTSVLVTMAFHANAAGASLVLAAGASADAPDGTFGPIHTAASPLSSARFGAGPILRVLLAHGARVDATDPAGRTALHRVTSGKGIEVLAPLLVLTRAGASQEARDRDGRTPLEVADALDDEGRWAARFLSGDAEALALAALLDALDRGDGAAVAEALPAVPTLDAGGEIDPGQLHHGGTALHLAVVRGRPDLVNLLVEAGADVQATDTRGYTALHAAAGRGDLATVRALLGAGADPDGPDEWPFMGLRPLHEAAMSGRPEVVRALLDAGADPLFAMHGGIGLGYNALGFAIAGGHEAVVQLLLDAGFDPDRLGETEETPLGLARSLHLDAIADRLLAAGATP